MRSSMRSAADYGEQLLAAALEYAGRGWHVLPLRPGDKRPAVPDHPATSCATPAGPGGPNRDPRCHAGHVGWQQRATTDPDRITRAWSSPAPRGGWYGVAIATGPSRLLVIDTDTPKDGQHPPARWQLPGVVDGEDVLAYLADEARAAIPETYTVRTRSGGLHRYYLLPDLDDESQRLANTSGAIGWLIDTRAAGGYVVAAPTTIDRRRYAVLDDRAASALPCWLHVQLRQVSSTRRPDQTATVRPAFDILGASPAGPAVGEVTRYAAAAVAGEVQRVQAAQPGRRNHELFVAALALGQLVGGNALNHAQAVQVLLDAVAGHVGAGAFTAAEALGTIRSGMSKGQAEPRRIRTGSAA